MKIRNQHAPEKNELNMTSMIDIVFLLLIFFVMTFKIVELEGDFSIKMPLAGTSTATIDPTDLPLKLRLLADDTGNLTGMKLNDIQMGIGPKGFDKLRGTIVSQIASAGPVAEETGQGPEVEIDTDYDLKYEYVIRAITAVSGYKDGDQVVKLIEKIKFAKPRR